MTQTIAEKPQKYRAFSGFPMELGTDFGMMGGPGAVLKTPSRPISNLVPEVTLPEQTVDGAARAVNPNWPSDLFDIAFIPLTKGKFALVDLADLSWLSKWRWRAQPARASFYAVSNDVQSMPMHREIINARKEFQVDHKNRIKLDNRRQNLRECTSRQNQLNCGPRPGLIPYRGVTKRETAYFASIARFGKFSFLGAYDTPEEAAVAYDNAARKLDGEFAALNFPDLTYVPRRRRHKTRPIRCVETGVVYASARDAAEALGKPRKRGGDICKVCGRGFRWHGFSWQYEDAAS